MRNDTRSHQRSGDSLGNGEMCPARAAAIIIREIAAYKIAPKKLADNPINYLEIDGKDLPFRLP